METLSQIVRNLVFLLLFYTFLEMLLPKKEARKFVQVILGLFVVVTVLNPLISLVEEDFTVKLNGSFSEEASSSENLQRILNDGKGLQEMAVDTAKEECREKLEGQAETVALAVPGVAEVQAEVNLLESGEISEVFLQVVMEDGTAVVGDHDSGDLLSREKTFSTIRQKVASSIGLNLEKVDVAGD